MNNEDSIDYEFRGEELADQMCNEIDKELIKELHRYVKKEKESVFDDAMEILNDNKK